MKKAIRAGQRENNTLIKKAKFKRQVRSCCPKCTEKLAAYDVYKIEIEICSKCKGLWLDKDKLRQLKDRSEKNRWGDLRWMDDEIASIEKAKARPSNRSCAKCRPLKLVSAHFDKTKTVIDWCPKCHGVWLDRGEYEKILTRLKHKLDSYSSKEMAEKVANEIREVWAGPENSVSEIIDVKASLSALINITIFEHPALCRTMLAASRLGRSIGLS